MKRDITKTLFMGVCAILIALAGYLLCTFIGNVKNNVSMHYSLVKPTVFDALTGNPLANATVVCTSDGRSYASDASGSTDWLAVYYPDGEELVLSIYVAKADGYKTTVLYSVTETAVSPLDGPVIYMFSGDEDDTVSMVYSPSDEYSENLRKKFTQND